MVLAVLAGLSLAVITGRQMLWVASDYPAGKFAPLEASDVRYPDGAYPLPETPSHCSKPTPSTPADYAATFAGLDPHQLGAADVALIVPLGDRRELWLYGDTFQAGCTTRLRSSRTAVASMSHTAARSSSRTTARPPSTGSRMPGRAAGSWASSRWMSIRLR